MLYKNRWRLISSGLLKTSKPHEMMNLFAVLLVVAIAGQSLASPSSRIIGGEPADIQTFPYQCSLRYSGSHTCGCVIISTSKVLTAAHCVDGRSQALFSVFAGATDRTGDGVLLSTSTMFVHDNYDDGSGTFANDIAVIALSSTFTFNANIQPGDLPRDNNNDFAGESCILTGWGRTSSSDVLPKLLMQTTTVVLSLEECRAGMSAISGVDIQHSMHICVMSPDKDSGSCNGDSGGPMNCGGKISGVTSWGISSGGNCLTTYPSVYTRVGNYYDWITSK